jgi:putative oxidoreductase
MNTSVQHTANGNSVAANTAALAGRILLALIFILSGYGKLSAFAGTTAFMTSKGLPYAEVLAALSIAAELGGGLAIVFGWKAREAAALIFLWMIPVTLIFHNPLGLDPALAKQQMIHLEKNLAIMGGLLVLFAFGAGRFGLDTKKVQA